MGKKSLFIAPIAIDLGASHTGVYSAFYKEGARPRDIERSGKVYTLNNSNYTLIMKERTARRHQRRGYDRRQMAKRLLKLIWENYFGLNWDDDVAQTVGFLMNRRGFSYLQEEYDREQLVNFPSKAWSALPDDFKELAKKSRVCINGDSYDMASIIQQWESDQNRVKKALSILEKKSKYCRDELSFYDTAIKIKEYCSNLTAGKDVKINLKKIKKISRRILDRLREEGVHGIDTSQLPNTVDFVEYLSQYPKNVNKVLSTIKDYSSPYKEMKKSVWNFDAAKFNFDKVNFDDNEEKDYIKNHINHLAFALQKIHSELVSGGRHRKKYFEEIYGILSDKQHKHGYLKHFCFKLQNKQFKGMNPEKLSAIIGHISNLELTPLRHYFNDKKHRAHDYWDEKRLTVIFGKWILNKWRINLENNPEKGIGKEQDYNALCRRWKKKKDMVIDFWMSESPVATIPPYQNKNNRNPPKCQSLILNSEFMRNNYPEWRNWVKSLKRFSTEYLGDLEQKFLSLRSGKNLTYFYNEPGSGLQVDSQKLTMEDLDARIFQFILDRRKDSDPFRLNDIYSRTKKLRQLKQETHTIQEQAEEKKKLQEALIKSKLPDTLKTIPDYSSNDIFQKGTFLHLACRYYKLRQRARDGRLFIHHEYRSTTSKGLKKLPRFVQKDQLLTYCNHKTRRKKYQAFYDVSALFQISVEEFLKRVHPKDYEDVISWLKGIKVGNRGLERLCREAAKAQKEYRGQLKVRINTAEPDSHFGKLKTSCESFGNAIGEKLFGSTKDIRIKKFSSVFSFAQLYNIVFTERNGNSNTCPVCSLDNSNRMEVITTGNSQGAKASRLPAVPTRLIDGAVTKMAGILSRQIVKDKWTSIERVLEEGHKVRIPIIVELNRFEFEPAIRKLKGKREGGGKENIVSSEIDSKLDRIKNSVNNICPYTGKNLGEGGEVDHIIPRSSTLGLLNDEANLIYASNEGNQKKKQYTYFLKDLNYRYKESLFGTTDDNAIEKWIEETIWDNSREDFVFGRYLSFINLNQNQQKAFRHALFLPQNSHLKMKVISALNNRRRAVVNGTQRFFAETLAEEFYKKALKNDKSNLLSFDFFGVEAVQNTKGEGIKKWRRYHEAMYGKTLMEYLKNPGESQKSYSHLLDAQIAFLIAIDKHRNEGSFRIAIPNDINVGKAIRKGELIEGEDLFRDIWVKPEEFEVIELIRRKPCDGFSNHRAYTRDTFYSDNYLPLLFKKGKDGKVETKVGFDWKNSVTWLLKKKDVLYLYKLLPLCKQQRYFPEGEIPKANSGEELYAWLIDETYFRKQVQHRGYIYLTVDKKRIHDYWMEEHNTKTGKPFDDFADFCYSKIGYRTEKCILVPEGNKNIFSILENNKNFTLKPFKTGDIILPVKKDWEKLVKKWKSSGKNTNEFDEFVREYFLVENTRHYHQKTRKVFSLKIKSENGAFLLKRKSWQGCITYQITSDSDSRKQHNKPYTPVSANNTLCKQYSSWAVAKNFVKLSKDNLSQGNPIDPLKWFRINNKSFPFPDGIAQIWMRIDDVTRPSIAIKLEKDGSCLNKSIIESPLCKPREGKDKLWKEKIQGAKEGDIIIYKGNSYTRELREGFKTSKEEVKPL